jgi:hypothetical protein
VIFAEENARKSEKSVHHSPPSSSLATVIAGLDPAIQLLAKRMDGRVKPGHDVRCMNAVRLTAAP